MLEYICLFCNCILTTEELQNGLNICFACEKKNQERTRTAIDEKLKSCGNNQD